MSGLIGRKGEMSGEGGGEKVKERVGFRGKVDK